MKIVRLSVFLSLAAVAALCVVLAFDASVRPACAAEGLWQTDFKAAQAQAKAEKKYLLVDFTGSDWCGWCIKLHNEVFDKVPFKAEAPKQFVLVELDFPHEKEQSDELKKQNKELADKFKIRGFPTVLVLDAEGQLVARTGYRDGGPESYLKHLAELPQIFEKVLGLKGKLNKVQGLDRAKLLDEIVEGYQHLGNEAEEVETWSKEIIALDPDNKAGLKVKYEFPLTLAKAHKLLQSGKAAEAQTLIDKALSLEGIPGELRQQGYITKFQISLSEKKFVDAVAAIKLAKEALPESRLAKQLDGAIQQFKAVAEAQEAADKLAAGLDKAEGLDRAKLLDKLIAATQKLLPFDPEAGKKTEKWTREIIALDADNKAGLKKKYQFKAVLAEAEELLQADKADEANTVLDNALKTKDISDEDIQAAQFMKAQISLQQNDNEEAVKCLKKALTAAPAGRLVPHIKMLLSRYDKPKKPAKKSTED